MLRYSPSISGEIETVLSTSFSAAFVVSHGPAVAVKEQPNNPGSTELMRAVHLVIRMLQKSLTF
jgi:hypothetical protein